MVSKYKLNAAFAVRNRSGKICNGPKRSIKIEAKRCLCGPESVRKAERFATVRKEAFKIQAKRCLCGPESARKDLQRSEKKHSKLEAKGFRNRSGIGPERFDMVGKQPASSIQRGGEGEDSSFERFRAVSDLCRTCFGHQSSGHN